MRFLLICVCSVALSFVWCVVLFLLGALWFVCLYLIVVRRGLLVVYIVGGCFVRLVGLYLV